MRPRLTVIGTGYLGAVHAACMAISGFEVLALDTDREKLNNLAAGNVPFHEPGLPEVLNQALESGNLKFTTSFEELGNFGDVHFICVGTPQSKDGLAADLTYVHSAVEALAPHLRRQSLIAGKSTVPVGTTDWIRSRVAELAPCKDIHIAWNPEFLREGFAVKDTLEPDRIVVGVTDRFSEEKLREVYVDQINAGIPFVVTTPPTAELVKAAANAFLATKISFINSIADICEASGADVNELADAIGHDTRIGRRFLNAGLGFGGGCLPKDIRAFIARAEELGVGQSLGILREVDDQNLRRRQSILDKAEALAAGDLTNVRIACLGAAFKPNSDDVRDSPALDVAARLLDSNADVVVYDPKASKTGQRSHPEITFVDSAEEALTDAQVVLMLTEWQEFVDLDPRATADLVAELKIVDARNALDPSEWRDAGWTYVSIGRP